MALSIAQVVIPVFGGIVTLLIVWFASKDGDEEEPEVQSNHYKYDDGDGF